MYVHDVSLCTGVQVPAETTGDGALGAGVPPSVDVFLCARVLGTELGSSSSPLHDKPSL